MTPNRILLLCALFALPSTANAVGVVADTNDTLAAMQAASASLQGLVDGCLAPSSKSNVGNLLGAIQGSSSNLRGNTQQFLQAAQASIQGNGRCDGGFESIVNGVQLKIKAGEKAEQIVFGNLSALMVNFMDDLKGAEIGFSGGGASCLLKGPKNLDAAKEAVQSVFPQIAALGASLDQEVEKMAAYQAQNRALQARCGGDSSFNMASPLKTPTGRALAAAIPGGNSTNPASTVTGDPSKEKLPESQTYGQSGIKSPDLKGQAAAIAGAQSASSHSPSAITYDPKTGVGTNDRLVGHVSKSVRESIASFGGGNLTPSDSNAPDEKGGANPPSVAENLFQENGGKIPKSLDLGAAPAAQVVASALPGSFGASAATPDGTAGTTAENNGSAPLPLVADNAPEGTRRLASMNEAVVAPASSDIFQLISSHYRKREQSFRK